MNMGNKDTHKQPFRQLGSQLKKLRELKRESMAEVSGAVEIDSDTLGAFESGSERPTEDILLLLISHFAAKEDIASKLWELAGYFSDQSDQVNDSQTVAFMPSDNRVIYTDMLHVMVNDYGLVMNFMQGTGANNQNIIVARVGMSKEHAKSVIEVLQKTLEQQKPKSLPANTQRSHSKKQSKE